MTVMSAQRSAVALQRNSIRELGETSLLGAAADKENERDGDDEETTQKRMNSKQNNKNSSIAQQPVKDDDDDNNNNRNNHADDFMTRLVDGPCHGLLLFPLSTEDGPCGGMATGNCQATLEQPLDFFTHCRQPLEFLSFFNESHDPDTGSTMVEVAVLPAGALRLHTYCEYCNCPDVKDCDPQTCTRPPFYFQKKRPPFCRRDPTKWDPMTEEPVPNLISSSSGTTTTNNSSSSTRQDKQALSPQSPSTSLLPPPQPVERRKSWVSGLFGNAGA